MQAIIDTNPLPEDTIDWWVKNKSTQFISELNREITAGSIWLASYVELQVENSTKEYEAVDFVAFVDPSTGDPGMLWDLRNEDHLIELRTYKPLPKGFRLILTQE